MTCCWCNGDHPSTCCREKIGIHEALAILGPVRAKEVADHIQAEYKERRYWLDGRIVKGAAVRKAALERRNQKNATN